LTSTAIREALGSISRKMGQQRRFRNVRDESAYPPNSGAKADMPARRIGATNGLMHRSKRRGYWITSSAI
jgi:hypothetical protein